MSSAANVVSTLIVEAGLRGVLAFNSTIVSFVPASRTKMLRLRAGTPV
jgi:hypothetical protein